MGVSKKSLFEGCTTFSTAVRTCICQHALLNYYGKLLITCNIFVGILCKKENYISGSRHCKLHFRLAIFTSKINNKEVLKGLSVTLLSINTLHSKGRLCT